MSDHLDTHATLRLLDGLKTFVCETTQQERDLEQDFEKRTANDRARFETATRQLSVRLQEALDGAERAHQAKTQRTRSIYQKRSLRIDKATRSAKRRVLGEAEGAEGARKNRLQIEIMNEDRRFTEERYRTDVAFSEERDRLLELIGTQVALAEGIRHMLGGYEKLLQLPDTYHDHGALEESGDDGQLPDDLEDLLNHADSELESLRRRLWPRLFKRVSFPTLMISVTIAHFGAAFASLIAGFSVNSFLAVGASWGAILVALPICYGIGGVTAKPAATEVVVALERARRLCDLLLAKSAREQEREQARLEALHEKTIADFHAQWDAPLSESAIALLRASGEKKVVQKEARLRKRIEKDRRSKLEQLEEEHAAAVERLKSNAKLQERLLADTYKESTSTARTIHETGWHTLETEWRTRSDQIYTKMKSIGEAARDLFPDWIPHLWETRPPPSQFPPSVKFGHVDVDLGKLPGSIPKDARLALPGPARVSLPLSLAFPHQGSVLLDTDGSGRDTAVGSLNNIILRLLTTVPPGKLAFTIFDPVELGQSFAGLMHLADYEESLVNSRIWTQTGQMEQRLADLNDHMEKVIQMYLRNDYDTITEYNQHAGDIAEKYHFLVIADFPVGFSDVAAKRLASIAASGARCGVYTLIHRDHRRSLPPDFVLADLKKNSLCLRCRGENVVLEDKVIEGATLFLERPPDPKFTNKLLHRTGRGSIDAYTVEVPFSHIAPRPDEVWTHDATEELRIPIGRMGATKLQYLSFGKGTRQHALIAGKTGSGKSTFFHVLVTNLSLWCSPEQVEFYLVDFKKGVEFKCYATKHLPHARVVAIESDREFGLSVLQRVDQELKRRGDLFRKLGVQDLPGYKRAGGAEPVPRTLLLIDEFQEFFVEDDRISQDASVLLDRIVRQGRAFGIHVLLGSQTLGGAYTLARSTLGQMVIRIALQCNEADAYLIMDDNNPAPRLLSRPGEAIYNDAAGIVEGNSPFQIVWQSDVEREAWLDKINDRVNGHRDRLSPPIVFEGNAPANVQENAVLQALLETKSVRRTGPARVWLGAPNSIKGPTEIAFREQGGNNLLIVGQRDESILSLIGISLLSLAAQHPVDTARFVLFDATQDGSPQRAFIDGVVRAVPHEVALARESSVADVMMELAEDLAKRQVDGQASGAPTTYVLIRNLQTYRKLRYEDDFSFAADTAANPATQLDSLIAEGPRLGMHVVVACDTFNTVKRVLSRKALSEFDARVLFQMSANDSAGLIDAPDASTLGLHRAVLYNDQQGVAEVFRPYALPGNDWVDEVAKHLVRLHGKQPHARERQNVLACSSV